MKIKVLHYLSDLGLGGTQKTAQLFSKYINRDNFESYIAFNDKADNSRYDLFREVTDGMFPLNGKDTKGLQKVINDLKIDIVHVYQTRFPDEFPAPGKDIEVPHFVVTNVFGFVDPNPKIDRDLFMSKWLMNYAIGGMTFYSGHPFEKRFDFVNNPVEKSCTNEKFDIPKCPRTIVLGRCGRPDNGIYNSINVRAAAELRKFDWNPFFVVVAPPPTMLEDLKKYSIPCMIIEPTVDPFILSKFYNSIDIYAHARADGETFGVNIAEAMIHRKPVITHVATPSVPGMGVFQAQTELIHNGMGGFVVNNNLEEYIQALRLLTEMSALRETFGSYNKEKALEEYEASVCVSKLEKIYKEVMNG